MAGYRESERQVVITGIGVVSPIGIGIDDFWKGLHTGISGVRHTTMIPAAPPQCRIAAEIPDFVPGNFTKTREQKKALRVMCREIQLGFAAAALALDDGGNRAGCRGGAVHGPGSI